MLTELRRSLPNVRALTGRAEAIPLSDASLDAVLAGNAIHWFDTADMHLPNWCGRPIRLTRTSRVPARAAPHGRLSRRDPRDARGDAGHARTGTKGHAGPDPRIPREQIRDRPRRIHIPDADRRAAHPAAMKHHLDTRASTHGREHAGPTAVRMLTSKVPPAGAGTRASTIIIHAGRGTFTELTTCRTARFMKARGWCGSRDWTRTSNLPVNSRTLCRLSYAGSRCAEGTHPPTGGSRLAHYQTGPRRPDSTATGYALVGYS